MTAAEMRVTQEVSIRGRLRRLPAWNIDDVVVVTRGKLPRIARIFDEYWLPAHRLPDPRAVVQYLRTVQRKPDLFTFAQRAPHSEPHHDFPMEWDNVAAIPISSHDHWLREQISSASRRNIKGSEKKGVTVRVCEFDEAYIRGIMSVFDESPTRHGRKYWHYGKGFEAVAAENGTYRERSSFLGAFLGDEMIGYTKIVWDRDTAAIMQILSKMQFFDRRPNNAMLSEAVKLCEARKVSHLLYESFVYGNNQDSSLTRFKRENGFVRIDLPRYYVPLTSTGRLCLQLGFHKRMKDRLPSWVVDPLLQLRRQFHEKRSAAR